MVDINSIRAVESTVLLSMIDEEQYMSLSYIKPSRKGIKISNSCENSATLSTKVYTFFKHAFILFCIVSVGFTAFISLDMQAGLEHQFLSPDGMNMTHSSYMDFLTFFSIPNIPGSFVGGFIVNSMGHDRAAVFFVAMSFTGQLLGAVGAHLYVTWVMFLGRMIFGVAIEVGNIAVFAYIVSWFHGAMYNFAFAMTVSIARLGSVLTMYVFPVMADTMMLRYGPNSTRFSNQVYTTSAELLNQSMNTNDTLYDSTPWTHQKSIVLAYGISTALILFSLLGMISLLFFDPPVPAPKDYSVEVETASRVSLAGSEPLLEGDTLTCMEKIMSGIYVILDVMKRLKFTLACWLVIVTCMIFYAAIEPWLMSAKMSFEKYHGVPDTIVPGENINRSALLSTLLSMVPIVGCPLMGILIDRIQGNAWFTFLGSFVSMVGHVMLMAPTITGSDITPYGWLVACNLILGIGYSMVASSIWTLMSYTVSPEDSNIAYGVIQSMQHVAFIITSKVSGAIIKEPYPGGEIPSESYFVAEIFYTGALMLASFVAIGFILMYGSGSKALFTSSYRRIQ